MLFLILFPIFKLSINLKTFINNECIIDKEIEKYVKSERLPDFIKPIQYYISYAFDNELTSYEAKSEIKIQILKRTKTIILHSVRNLIISINIKKNHTKYFGVKEKTGISSICLVRKSQFIVIKLSEYLEKETFVTLQFSFISNISLENKGIFYSFYKNAELKEKYFNF